MWQYNYTTELYHYGVPGMKWGKRKAVSLPAGTGNKRTKNTKSTKLNTKKTKKEISAFDISRALTKPLATINKVMLGIGMASLGDDIFYGGMGKKILKTGVEVGGRCLQKLSGVPFKDISPLGAASQPR